MGPIFARGESKLMQRLLVILRSFPCKCCIVWVGVIHSPLISFLQAEKKFRNPKTPTNLKEIKEEPSTWQFCEFVTFFGDGEFT